MISPFLTKLIEDDKLFAYCKCSYPLRVGLPYSNFIFSCTNTPYRDYFNSLWDITNQFCACWTQEDIDYIKNNYPELLI